MNQQVPRPGPSTAVDATVPRCGTGILTLGRAWVTLWRDDATITKGN